MKSRLEANREIVKKISETVEKFPNWRFHQIMQNLGLELGGSEWDLFYEESAETLFRLEQAAPLKKTEKNRKTP